MSSERTITTLGAICDAQGGAIQTGPFGSQLHTSDYTEVGVPVVMPTNIGEGGISEEGIARIGQNDVERLSQHKLLFGDIVFSRRGDVTKNALVSDREVGWLCGTGCLKVRLGTAEIANHQFISYYLRLPETKEWLVRHAVGATMPNLNTGILSAVPVELPPLDTQKWIAGLLGSLDECIAALRQTNATLEAMAQAIFKSWFIDFDPVHAKSKGLAPMGMDEAAAALFPDSFEESALGVIPRGWFVDEIGKVADCVGGGTPSTKEEAYWAPEVHHWVTPKDLSGLNSPVLMGTERKLSDQGLQKVSSGLLPRGTLLMSSRAPIGYLVLSKIAVAINQGFIAMKPGGRLPPEYLYFWTASAMDEIKQKANGSTFMEISKSAFRPIKLVVPPAPIVAAFVDVAGAIFDSIESNEAERSTLTELRDTLLPRLISGKLRIPAAEALIEDVAA